MPGTINCFKDDDPARAHQAYRETGWWFAKYDRQPRIDLNRLSDKCRTELMRQFGIRLGYDASPANLKRSFLTSPAFAGLVEWTKKHPKLAKLYSICQDHIG